MVAARLISGHIKATDGTEIASIILNGWQVLKSTMRAAHAKASLDTRKKSRMNAIGPIMISS